jgi:Holliday junction resolvasome RuvABC endonuclease subunit
VESLEAAAPMTIILALDLGTTTGWACGEAKAPAHGTWDLKPSRYDGGGMRFVKFRNRIHELHIAMKFDLVFYEEVRRHAGTDAAHVYGGLLGQLTEWCERNFIPYQGVPVGVIKKYMTGKGNAGKAAMVAAVQAQGYVVKDDNEADALALFLWRRDQQMSETGLEELL